MLVIQLIFEEQILEKLTRSDNNHKLGSLF